MLPITQKQKELFNNDSSAKEITLELSTTEDNGTIKTYIITNENIISESMELNEGLSTEKNIRYGQCFSNRFSIDVFNIKSKFGKDIDFIGYNLKVNLNIKIGEYLYPDNMIYPLDNNIYPNGTVSEGVSLPLFKGIVQDSKLADNRNNRKLTAYDELYFKLNTDMSDLYWNDFLKNTRTVKYIRETILSTLGIKYEPVKLTNDDMTAFIEGQQYTKLNSRISARVALESALEICGCFGHINRYGLFEFKQIKSTYLNYPALKTNALVKYPTSDLYLGWQTSDTGELEQDFIETYITCQYGENKIKKITGVQFIQSNNNIIDEQIVSNDNVYISKGNIYLEYLPGGFSVISSTFSNALYQQISDITYYPVKLQISGKPYLEVGDYITVETKNEDKQEITFPILQRNLKGIQSLRDTFEAKGDESRK